MIYTGYFDKLDDYVKQGLTPVCIAGYPPKEYAGICYQKLAPKRVWWQEWHDQKLSNMWYESKYQETVLSQLSPQGVANDFAGFGKDVVLLCYEKPSEFCHRQLVSKWLNQNHIVVKEYDLTLAQSRERN